MMRNLKVNKVVAIVGLGNVGLPVAQLCALKGYETKGLEKNRSIVDEINARSIKNLKATLEPVEALAKADIIVVCVQTSIGKGNRPDLSDLTKALQQITAFLRKGVLVIVESTIPVGAIRETVLPVLEKSGLACGRGFYLAYCPERLDVGNVEWPLRKIPRVLGAIDSTSARKAAEFYSSILESEIIELSSVETVELTKLLENSFRELNIAFVNELSSIVPKFGISLNEVIKGASTKPFGFMPFFPGPGIGGNCIATSTFFLLYCLKQIKGNSGLLSLSRSINTKSMLRVVDLVEEAMTELGKPPEGSVVTILGLSYKENVSDMTGSPAFAICDQLVKRGYPVKLFDPCVKDLSTAKSLEDSLKESDCVVLTIKRKQFQRLSADYLERMKVRSIVDCKRQLDGGSIAFHGIIYKCIG